MGIIISNDTKNEYDRDRELNTPEGDILAYGQRISAYLQAIKSKATTASIFKVRDAHFAGLPKPPIDMTADMRAPVPEEMFPKVLVATNNHPFKDFEGGFGEGYIVSAAFRDAVEIFDKGVHQFVPVDIRRKDGGQHDNRPFFILRVTRLIGAINFDASPELRPAGGGPREDVKEDTPVVSYGTTFVVHADRIAGMGLWRDLRTGHLTLAGQRLVNLLTERKLTGWSALAKFVEV